MKNYKDEVIPDIEDLIAKAKKSLVDLSESKMWSFEDFFRETKNGEFSRRPTPPGIACEEDEKDISGVYVLFDKDIPVYVGISKQIVKRIKQHMKGKRHNESTVAYIIYSKRFPHTAERAKSQYDRYRLEIQKEMLLWGVKIILEDDPYAMDFLEKYFAIKLQTKWNTFSTH